MDKVTKSKDLWLPATWIGLFVALVVPFLIFLGTRAQYGSAQTISRVEWGLFIHWLNFIALILIVIRLEKRPLSSIGLRTFRWWTLPLGTIAGIAVFATFPLISRFNAFLGLTSDQSFAAFLFSLPFWMRAAIVLTAGIFEETLFRGYGIERLTQLTGSKWIAAMVTWIVFTLAHIPAVGFAHLLPVCIVAFFVTLLYVWKRDLVVNIVAHVVIDGIGLLVLPALV